VTSTNKSNLFPFALFCVFIITFIFSKHFIVNEELFIFKWHYIISFTIGIFFLKGSFKENGEFNKKFKNKYIQSFILRVIMITGLPFAIIFYIEKSLFFPLHLIFKKNEIIEKNVVVLEKNIGGRSKIKFLEISRANNLTFPIKLGKFNKAYDDLNIGDEITLRGEKSIFGFSVEEVSYKNKHN
jgi:hypothetical protein